MARKIDFNELKARTIRSANDEEAVTVDTRGLISKVLARYSGKWTVLRELIQNASDACATRVTIKFETLPSTTVPLPSSADSTTLVKHTITNHTLRRLLISNNGNPFSEKDWARLKRIADGNPDETKIGAFGVGFYSVFDDCEEPFVSSGDHAMAFYWKGNALFTRRLELDEGSRNPETTFVLDYRNITSPVPSLMQLCQFLSSSLTFVGLEEIHLYLDDWNLLRLTKKIAPSTSLTIPKDVETKTAQGLFRVTNVTREIAQIDAAWMRVAEWSPQVNSSRRDDPRDNSVSLRAFFSRLTGHGGSEKPSMPEKVVAVSQHEDMTGMLTASVFLHINTASIQAFISQSLASELERATRKQPPKTTAIAVLTPSYDANMASGASASESQILASILPSKAGKIFIGFPTHQTTGLNAHISAPSVIPTVERESIDLNSRYISKWNVELVRAAGITCRIAWSAEMASLNSKIMTRQQSSKAKIRKVDMVDVLPEAIHTANQFVFRESTPSSVLGQKLEDAFWTCNRNASIEVVSTCGIIQSHLVRIAHKELSFMDTIPVLPDELVSNAKDFVKKLTDFGLVTEITVSDIKKELEKGTLRSKQVGEFLAWLGRRAVSGQFDASSIQTLLSVAVANDEDNEGDRGRLLVLADITTFLNPQRIPADLPLPPFAMPFKFTKNLPKRELEALGWKELQIIPWIQWLVATASDRDILDIQQDITQTASFSAQILPVLSRHWDTLSQSSKKSLVDFLRPQTVIPTKLGMKRPSEAYFSSVKLFDDLPVVYGLNGVKEKFLAALGVRKTVELGVIFDRLLDTTKNADAAIDGHRKWSHVDLIRYLASVRADIPEGDIERLKQASICTAEVNDNSHNSHRKLFKISELFEPKASIRNLDVPVIEWPGKYQASSNEGKFLTTLGLRGYPSAEELIRLMAGPSVGTNSVIPARALSYFISEYYTNGYTIFNCSAVDASFLPLEGSESLSAPSKCFTDDGAVLLGFQLLRRDLHPHASKLGVRQHPPMSDCLDILIRQPPKTKKDARLLFKYLSGRVSELTSRDSDRVGRALIVPVSPNHEIEKSTAVRFVAPTLCYLGEGEEYKDIFDFVNFGPEANLFLMAVGSKREPSKLELARMLVREPARISSLFQGPEKYLKLLRTLAEHLPVLKQDRELFNELKRAAFLFASRDISSQARKDTGKGQIDDSDDELYAEDEQSIREWSLISAKDVVVVDDFQSFNIFKEHISAAPQEELLENFYLALGSVPLSSIIEERAHWGSVASDQRPAIKLQKRINERSRLFLHDQSSDSIRHDIRWLEKHLNVQVVNSILLTRSIKGRRVSHTQKRSAIITQQPNRTWMLWICPGAYDLYEISQALVHLILVRPKLHSILTLEMLLKTDLLELRARGYNVERILKQRAHEARMAEDRRQKQLEEERRQLLEREDEWNKGQVQLAQEQPSKGSIPGQFPDSPNNKEPSHDLQPQQPDIIPRSKGLFSNLTKRFGLEHGHSIGQTLFGHPSDMSPGPPPYSFEDPNQLKPEGRVHPHQLQNELISAVQACRSHGSTDVYSRPGTSQVIETRSYCDEKPSQDLQFAATLPSGINVLLAKAVHDRSAFLTDNGAGLNLFAALLIDCAGVFTMPTDSLSIFYDAGSKTIAFNRAGSIFCNYFYFEQLHRHKILEDAAAKSEALIYWWVILCHELAHNLVEDHNSAHSYYCEGFVAQYFPKVAMKLGLAASQQKTSPANEPSLR